MRAAKANNSAIGTSVASAAHCQLIAPAPSSDPWPAQSTALAVRSTVGVTGPNRISRRSAPERRRAMQLFLDCGGVLADYGRGAERVPGSARPEADAGHA